MPLLTLQNLKTDEPSALDYTALDGATDSFPFTGTQETYLLLRNTDVSDITVTLIGDQATSVKRSGIVDIDVSAGKDVLVPAGSDVKVSLLNAAAYLSDSESQPDITGGAATLLAALVA